MEEFFQKVRELMKKKKEIYEIKILKEKIKRK